MPTTWLIVASHSNDYIHSFFQAALTSHCFLRCNTQHAYLPVEAPLLALLFLPFKVNTSMRLAVARNSIDDSSNDEHSCSCCSRQGPPSPPLPLEKAPTSASASAATSSSAAGQLPRNALRHGRKRNRKETAGYSSLARRSPGAC